MELDLSEIIGIILKKIKVIIASTLLCGLAAFLISSFVITPQYSASGTMYVYNTGERNNSILTSSDIATSQKLVATYIVIMQSDAVMEDVAERVNLGYTIADIRRMFTASALNSTEVFEVSIKNSNPLHAQLIANAFLDVSPNEIMRVVKAGSVEVIDHATLPKHPISPRIPQNTAVGALFGFVISAMGAIVLAMMDTKIKSTDELEELFDLPVLGSIPPIESHK